MTRRKPAHEKLAAAIAEAERRGVTRYAIARDSGVNKNTIANIAEGRTIPRLDTAEKIAGVLGLTVTIEPAGR